MRYALTTKDGGLGATLLAERRTLLSHPPALAPQSVEYLQVLDNDGAIVATWEPIAGWVSPAGVVLSPDYDYFDLLTGTALADDLVGVCDCEQARREAK